MLDLQEEPSYTYPIKKRVLINYIDSYDHVIENLMVVLNMHKIETVEALSACGFEGILHGLDENRKGVIAKFPDELHKAYQAGIGLVKGQA